MLHNGDAVFFKRAKKNTARRTTETEFKGHGFGIMLGHVPLFGKDPSDHELLILMGQNGFISFDDLIEFLGEEQGRLCLTKFEDKYYGKVIEPEEASKETSQIVGEDGRPLSMSRQVDPIEPVDTEVPDATR